MCRSRPVGSACEVPTTVAADAAQARRIALAAQGFADPRPAGPGRRPAHPPRRSTASRSCRSTRSTCSPARTTCRCSPGSAPTRATSLDRMTGYDGRSRRGAELFEYWAHAASLIPVELHPLLRWRMARAHVEPWQAHPPHRARTTRRCSTTSCSWSPSRARSAAGDTGIPRPAPRPGHMWNWHDGKIALEYLFYEGGSPPRSGSTSSGTTTSPSGCCRPRSWPRRPRRRADAHARAGPHLRPRARRRHRARPARLLPPLARRDQGARSPSSSTPASSSRSRSTGWDAPGYLWHEARRPAAGRARGRCCPRSTR